MEDNVSYVTACGSGGVTDLPGTYVILGVVMFPMLLILCTAGNIAVILTMKMYKRKSTSVYLSSMAVANMIIMWLQIPKYIYPFLDSNVDASYTEFLAGFTVFETWASQTLVNAEDWILIAFSIERLSAILWPLVSLKWISYRNAVFVVLVIFLLTGLYAIHHLVFYSWWLAHDDGVTAFSMSIPKWLRDWNKVQTEAEITFTLIKFSLILIINVTLVTFLTRRQKALESPNLFSSNSPSPQFGKSAVKKSSSSRQLLLACFVLYFVTQLPTLIMICLNLASAYPYCSYEYQGDGQVILAQIASIFLWCNYSLNFLFYCSFSSKFRAVFRRFSISSFRTKSISS